MGSYRTPGELPTADEMNAARALFVELVALAEHDPGRERVWTMIRAQAPTMLWALVLDRVEMARGDWAGPRGF